MVGYLGLGLTFFLLGYLGYLVGLLLLPSTTYLLLLSLVVIPALPSSLVGA